MKSGNLSPKAKRLAEAKKREEEARRKLPGLFDAWLKAMRAEADYRDKTFLSEIDAKQKAEVQRKATEALQAVERQFREIDAAESEKRVINMPTLRVQLKDLKYLCGQDLKKMISTTTSLMDRCILKTFAQTGMSVTQLANLDIRDIDLGGYAIYVRGGKGTKTRWAYPSADLVADLECVVGDRERGPVFTNSRGSKLTVGEISKISHYCQALEKESITGKDIEEIASSALKEWYSAIQAGKKKQARKQIHLVIDVCISITTSHIRVSVRIIGEVLCCRTLFDGLKYFTDLPMEWASSKIAVERDIFWQQMYDCWSRIKSASDVYHKRILNWVLSRIESLEKTFLEPFGPVRRDTNLPRLRSSPRQSEIRVYYYIKFYLKSKGVEVLYHHSPKWLGRQHLDISVPSLNIAFEYQGAQHFRPVKIFGGEEAFEKTKKRDETKRAKCVENNVKLFYLGADQSYDFYGDIEAIIDKYLSLPRSDNNRKRDDS